MQELMPCDAERGSYIYIMISVTPSKFGKALRRIGGITYNHASIAFDEEFRQLYSFGRRQNSNPLSAGLVREYTDRFTLKKTTYVNVRIYRLRVTREQILAGKRRLCQIMLDPDGYLYNLFSVLSFPFLHGVRTYKAYTCAEFVASILRDMGVGMEQQKPCCGYTPEDISKSAGAELVFEGNLLDYCTYKPKHEGDFFDRVKYRQVAKTSCTVTFRLIYRMIRYRNRASAY